MERRNFLSGLASLPIFGPVCGDIAGSQWDAAQTGVGLVAVSR